MGLKSKWEKIAFDYTKALKAKNIFTKSMPSWLSEAKKITSSKLFLGGAGVGAGGMLAVNYLKDDGHDKLDHGRKKTAETMTKMEKADQKYAIAMSYKKEGHPRKAKEYKSKAARAYKTAWEKRAFEKNALSPELLYRAGEKAHKLKQGLRGVIFNNAGIISSNKRIIGRNKEIMATGKEIEKALKELLKSK